MYSVGYTALLISLFKLFYAINRNLLMLFGRPIFTSLSPAPEINTEISRRPKPLGSGSALLPAGNTPLRGACRLQAITLPDVELSWKGFCGTHMAAISQDTHMISIWMMSAKITFLRWLPHLWVVDELNVYLWLMASTGVA